MNGNEIEINYMLRVGIKREDKEFRRLKGFCGGETAITDYESGNCWSFLNQEIIKL